jgi:hypothetical protein
VRAGSKAAGAGLRKGDTIVSVNRIAVTTLDDLASRVKESPERLLLNVVRDHGGLCVSPIGVLLRYRARQKILEEKMPKARTASSRQPATHDDVKSILGDLDDIKMLPILALKPTVADLEQASMWLGGDRDVFGAAEPLKGIASQIVTILTANEEDEPPRAG